MKSCCLRGVKNMFSVFHLWFLSMPFSYLFITDNIKIKLLKWYFFIRFEMQTKSTIINCIDAHIQWNISFGHFSSDYFTHVNLVHILSILAFEDYTYQRYLLYKYQEPHPLPRTNNYTADRDVHVNLILTPTNIRTTQRIHTWNGNKQANEWIISKIHVNRR